MRNVIQLKKAAAVEVGEHVLTPQHGTGILLAYKVISTEVIDDGKRIELGTAWTSGKRLHVVGTEDIVLVVI